MGRLKYFECGDVIPGCLITFTGLTEEDILDQVVDHARVDHGISAPPPELEGLVRTAIRPPPVHRDGLPPYRSGPGQPPGPPPLAATQERAAPQPNHRRLRSAFDDAPIGMAITTPTGAFIDVNSALGDLLGRTPQELLTRRLDDVLAANDVEAARTARGEMLASGTHRHHAETHLVHAQGHTLVALLTCTLVFDGPTNTPAHIVCHFQDITDRVAERDALAHQSLHDPLTGLPNRILLFDRLEQALQRSVRQQTRVGVVFCDLDHFKRINDTYGHAAGDLVLAEFARWMRAVQRPGDTTGRLAGDEFVMLCEDNGQLRATSIIERIQRALIEPFTIDADVVTITVSIGVAIAHDPDTTPADLVQAADQAMYAAKRHRQSG